MAKVMLVDDDDAVRYAIGELLRDAGYDVCEASCGERAIETLQTEEVDLVVTDIFMPHVDGIDLILHVREHNPMLNVIAFSGGGMQQDPKLANALASMSGADQVMQKPVDSEAFIAMVAKLIAG